MLCDAAHTSLGGKSMYGLNAKETVLSKAESSHSAMIIFSAYTEVCREEKADSPLNTFHRPGCGSSIQHSSEYQHSRSTVHRSGNVSEAARKHRECRLQQRGLPRQQAGAQRPQKQLKRRGKS